MNMQKFVVFVPYEIGDILQYKNNKTKYLLLDILHTYSAKEQNIVNVKFELLNLATEKTKVVLYNNEYKIITVEELTEQERKCYEKNC